MATSANKTGETIPVFVVSPVVTIEMGVTSDPVPAVVGTKNNGSRGGLALLTPYKSDNICCCCGCASMAMILATSNELPPPKPKTISAFSFFAN